MNENLGNKNLHPTMYLLILERKIKKLYDLFNLHPTMYLLIHSHLLRPEELHSHLHPTMYLLIQIMVI